MRIAKWSPRRLNSLRIERRETAALLLLAICLWLFAAPSAVAIQPPKFTPDQMGGTLRGNFNAEPQTLNPLTYKDLYARIVKEYIVEVVSLGEVRMRTWERGSGLTLACGTGASAVCVAGVLTGRTGRRVLAHVPGGDLVVEWPDDGAAVTLTGPVEEVFTGEWPE